MTVTRIPFSGSTLDMIAFRICSALGDAKIVPATAADSSPSPTKAPKLGSWPLPPPEMMDTCEA